MKQITCCVLLIGNELLSGRTRESNLQYIAEYLIKKGVRVSEARVIPDVPQIIADTVNEVRKHHNYVFTTGGIGPTHDDITAESVALAFDVPLVVNETIAKRIKAYTGSSDTLNNRLRMARVPEGAGLIENLTGGPHGFYIDNVYVMAGIPSVLRAMLPTIDIHTVGAVIYSCSFDVLAGESHIAHELEEVQAEFSTIEIGSYPFARDGKAGTSIVFRGTDTELLSGAFNKTKRAVYSLGLRPVAETLDWSKD